MKTEFVDCPFCSKECQSNSFMESAHSLAIYNIAPIMRGHSLVIPKRHIRSLQDLSEGELFDFFLLAREATQVLNSAFVAEGFDWSIQEGSMAGQSVEHLHLHIVVRKTDDLAEGENWYDKVKVNEATILDSQLRARLSKEEYLFYTDFIRNEAIHAGCASLKKEE